MVADYSVSVPMTLSDLERRDPRDPFSLQRISVNKPVPFDLTTKFGKLTRVHGEMRVSLG